MSELANDYPILGRSAPTKLAFPSVLLAPHEEQARKNHGGQSLERLKERGGLSADEMVAILEDRPWHPMTFGAAWDRLCEIRKQAEGGAKCPSNTRP